jgi:LytS/YehU family sensor histidine kinase
MRRTWVWLQLIIGWLPVGALFATIIVVVHGVDAPTAALISIRMMVTAALLGLLVRRLTKRFPWPSPFRLPFAAVHMLAAPLYAGAWLLANSVVESVVRGTMVIVVGSGLVPFLVVGIWLYVMVAGVSYATDAAERAARAETLAARAQLAALRAQLHPHFLFNALHSVVQLIPLDPDRAAGAAAELGALLRTTIEEDRDLVTVAEERAFVERYLELERMRFGERLHVAVDVSDDADATLIPSFSLLTLVENAVRHGAEPRMEPTEVTVLGRTHDGVLTITVRDTGYGASEERLARSEGTGLRRLRDRLAALYAGSARLELASSKESGFVASLTVPRRPSE